MSEEIQTPPQPSETNNSQPIQKKPLVPTWVGFVIVFLIVIAFLIFFWKFRQLSTPVTSQPAPVSQNQPATSGNTSTETPTSNATVTPAQDGNAATPATIDNDIKNLDETINSVNDSDFNSGDFSDLEVGL